MQEQLLQFYAVQFFSRSYSREDLVKPNTKLAIKDGVSLGGFLTLKFGTPLLEGRKSWTPRPGGEVKVRPNYAQPWQYQEGSSTVAGERADPYAEIRWPTYALASFTLSDQGAMLPRLDAPAQCDLLQALRSLFLSEMLGIPEIKALSDQVCSQVGFRFGYWTAGLDFAGNPAPVETGDYINADRAELRGPGYAALRGTGHTRNGSEYCSLALVWSQAFSFPNRINAQLDAAQIEKRVKDLKFQFSTKEDLKRADDCLQRRDLRECISSAQIAVESALRFYCTLWGVRSPSLPGIEFDQRVERILKRAERPSYQAIDPRGLKDLLYLYRASLKAHEATCSYRDDQIRKDVPCELWHAQQFLDAAIKFTFWLDSQA